MGNGGLLDGMWGYGYVSLSWIAANAWIIAAAAAVIAAALIVRAVAMLRRRQAAVARAARAKWVAHDLKEQVRERLGQLGVPLGSGLDSAPTIGVCEVLAADIEAAAHSVLLDAGGRRGGAKHVLRQRLLNGSGGEAAVWRQLGALALLDSPGEALKAYSRAVEIAPDDPQAQMLLGILALRTGHLEKAEKAFQRQMELAGESGLAARHRARTMLGDVLVAKGEPAAALTAYEEARAEAVTLAEREPDNAAWQRDVSITHDRTGDVHLADGRLDAALESYRASLAIAEKIAGRDRENLDWQRDLSVAHDRVGEVLERKADLDGALASYRTGLALAEAIASHDPERLAWRWDVSASLDRIGNVLLAMGKAHDALTAYRRGLEIAEAAVAAEPGRTDWQRDLAVGFHKVGTLEATDGNAAEASEYLERGRAIISRLHGIATRQAQWRADLAKFDQAIRDLGL